MYCYSADYITVVTIFIFIFKHKIIVNYKNYVPHVDTIYNITNTASVLHWSCSVLFVYTCITIPNYYHNFEWWVLMWNLKLFVLISYGIITIKKKECDVTILNYIYIVFLLNY